MKERLTLMCIASCRRILKYLLSKQLTSKDILQDSLAPKLLTEKQDIERIEPYLSSLRKALNTPDINNIAITGSYGSGKSSILKSFQHRFDEFTYLNISLASFSNGLGEKKDQEKDDKKEFERALEVSVLQQMFYHIQPEQVPDSRFKRIINITKGNLMTRVILILISIYSGMLLFKFDRISKLNPSSWDKSLPLDWVTSLASVIFTSGVAFFIYAIYRFLSKSTISKINLQGEVELGQATDKSVFNQHIEEILYFFERTDFDVIFLEDIDRFESTDIFVKLREINVLLNNSQSIKRTIKFVYAIKDDMFKDMNDRVKFFEYVIPIIPFINPSNAEDQLTKLLKAKKLDPIISQDFYSDVVSFIDTIEMRLLINIVNEFDLLRTIVSGNLNQDNLFAMIVYKNLLPDDFAQLSKRNGKLYSVLSQRKIFVAKLCKDLRDEITSKREEIKQIESEGAESKEDLRAVYLIKLASKMNKFGSFYVNSKHTSIDEARNDSEFAEIKNSSNIEYVPYTYNYNSSGVILGSATSSKLTLTKIQNEVSEEFSYEEREKHIEDRINGKIDELKEDILKLNAQISLTDSKSVPELFQQGDLTDYLKEFEKFPLIKNFIINGYLNENYADYISILHEGNLTKEDFAFLIDIKSGTKRPYTLTITNPYHVIKRLPSKYFAREEIFNFSLLNHMLSYDGNYQQELKLLFETLNLDRQGHFQFALDFIDTNPTDLRGYIERLASTRNDLWHHIKSKSFLPESQVDRLLMIIFENASLQSIENFTSLTSLVTYIKLKKQFFEFCSKFENTDALKEFIKKHNVQLSYLDHVSKDPQNVFKYVYENDLYEINAGNISAVLSNLKSDIEITHLETCNYTTLLKSGEERIIQYVSKDLNGYVQNVLLKIEGNTAESESTIIQLLNEPKLSYDLKKQFINKQVHILKSFEGITNPEAMTVLIETDKVSPTWENVYSYSLESEDDGLGEKLIAYLNRAANFKSLANEKLRETLSLPNVEVSELSMKVATCNTLTDEAYGSLLNSTSIAFDGLPFDEIEEEHIRLLIQKGLIEFNAENFSGIADNAPALVISFIETNSAQFLKLSETLDLDSGIWNLYLKSQAIPPEDKRQVLALMDTSLIVDDPSLAETVSNLIPLEHPVGFEFEVWTKLFQATKSTDRKLNLLNAHLKERSAQELKSLINSMGDSYGKISSSSEVLTFDNTKQNANFFKILEAKGLLQRFKRDSNKKQITLTPIPDDSF